MSILDLAHSVGSEAGDYTPPPLVSGRVLVMDADSMVYQCARIDESFEENLQYLVPYIQQWRIRAGAETIQCHLTLGTKGNRENIAQVQEYQANRAGKDQEVAARVLELKQWLTNYAHPRCEVIAWTKQEADDGVTQAMYAGKFSEEVVLYSEDKDLWMVPGLHMQKKKPWKLERFPTGYGHCYFEEKKLRGKGTSWFWHQLIMGDRVDNIPGLPKLMPKLQAVGTVEARLIHEVAKKRRTTDGKMLSQAGWLSRQAKLKQLQDNKAPKPIGERGTYEYLKHCRSDKQALRMVKIAYEAYYGTQPFNFTDWNDNTRTMTAGHMLVEQARLLWMRRTENEDVITFFKEVTGS